MNRHRFGKGRVLGCECTERSTCGPCLKAAAERNLREQRTGRVERSDGRS